MKKFILLLITTITISTGTFGQKVKSDTVQRPTAINAPIKLTIDTLKIQNVDKENSKVWYMDNNMPWIIALIISTLGILVNVYISNRQIKATLNTTNRQAWVNETRNVITDLMTQAKLLNIEFQENEPNLERKKNIHEKVTQNRTKLLLLLKSDKATHIVLLDSLKEFINTLDEHLLNRKAKDEHGIEIPFDEGKFMEQFDKIITNGRALLYDEWDKIQSIT